MPNINSEPNIKSPGHPLTLVRHREAAVIELRLEPAGRPTFSVPTLVELAAVLDEIAAAAAGNAAGTYRYLHFTAASRDVFSMGGDLPTIAAIAEDRDLARALDYGHRAAAIIHRLWNGLGLELVTTACVAGKAFGAGFEAMLACNRAVCDRNARFCLPEARFGLFPGMGATSLLGRRIGSPATDELIATGRIMTAGEAHDRGLVDALVDRDVAASELREALAGGEPRWARLMDQREARRSREGFSLDEVTATTTRWAERVVALGPDDLATLKRVAAVQEARSRAARR